MGLWRDLRREYTLPHAKLLPWTIRSTFAETSCVASVCDERARPRDRFGPSRRALRCGTHKRPSGHSCERVARQGGQEGGKRLELPASGLLQVIEDNGGLHCVDLELLREGLDLTQPFRHGRADDEFSVIVRRHIKALENLDEHPSLRLLKTARGKSLEECVVVAFLGAG